MDLTFQEIVAATKGSAFGLSEKELARRIQGVSIDSRQVQPGDLFFALRGERYDAHTFLSDVISKKGVAAVVDRRWAQKNRARFPNAHLIVVNNTLEALQETAAFYRSKFRIPVVAVTGSNGKTTTKEMTAAVLTQKKRVLKNAGNLNNHIGLPLTLFQLTHETEIAVVEMGANHFGEIARLCEIAQPDFGLITNIGAAHLQYFGSLQNVARAKAELFEYLSRQNGLAFVNLDDPLVSKIAEKRKRIWSFAFSKDADVRGDWVRLDSWGQPVFKISGTEIRLNVPGNHQAQNALAAAAVGLFFNLPLEDVKKGLESFRGVSKRMELVETGEILILNDSYNANLNSMEQALKTLAHIRHQRGGRAIAVLGDMLELGAESEKNHRRVGEWVAETGVSFLLTFGNEARAIHETALRKGVAQAVHFDKKADLQKFLANLLRGGDLVLVKGSRGMEMETIVDFLRREFSAHPAEQ